MKSRMISLYRGIIPEQVRGTFWTHFNRIRSSIKDYWKRRKIIYTNLILSRRFHRHTGSFKGPVILIASQIVSHSLGRTWLSHFECLLAKYLELIHGAKIVFYFDEENYVKNSLFRGFNLSNYVCRNDVFSNGSVEEQVREIMHKAQDLNDGEMNTLMLKGVPIGRLALASARYVHKKSKICSNNKDRQTLYDELRKAVETLAVAEQVLDLVKPDYVITNHSTYVDRGGIFFHLALMRDIPALTWQARTVNRVVMRRFTFSERLEHVGGLNKVEWKEICEGPDSPNHIAEAQEFLESRIKGHHEPLPRAPRIGLQYQPKNPYSTAFPHKKPVVAVFTHLPWDAAGSFYKDLFHSLRDWIECTVRLALSNDKVNWLFRIHPAEAVRGTNENTSEIIRDMIPIKNDHIRIIESGTPISSYSLMQQISAAVTVRGTLSIEMSCMGIPVICAGTGPASVSNFNIYPNTVEEYCCLLKKLPDIEQLSIEKKNTALLFLYAYMIRKPVRIECVEDFSLLKEMAGLKPDDITHDSGLHKCADLIMTGNDKTVSE